MSIAHTVAEVLEEHVVLEVEGIDRMYLNVYVPQLQRELGVASFFRFHRGFKFASSALMLRSEEHTSELQSRRDLVCRLLLEKKKKNKNINLPPKKKINRDY